uniref:AMP-dependent synthetase/ligase domain-containing protein n=1 Tax=Alexandrium monilatum TaxID=311494 RepID=A0A7S4UF06_9DINO|mmetsp:Transcript_5211/g.15443  ORF Transcript_5211/g.15443 Transcript_5211/m.15443 type:complete len:655 (+) Transcript_5211:89-2053(+)
MKSWTTEGGEGSAFFDTSVSGICSRAKIWAKANNVPEAGVDDAFQKLIGPGGSMEITEAHVRHSDGTTKAPHFAGPSSRGQRYRLFKEGPHLLGDVCALAAQVHGDKPFIAYRGPDSQSTERYTFREAYGIAEGVAAYLHQELGLKKGDRVAQISRNSPEWMISFMAASLGGFIAVPTNSLWVHAEIEYGMNDSGTAVAFADGERAEKILALCREGKLPGLKAVVVSRDPANVAAQGGGATRVLKLADVLAASQGRKLPPVEVSPEDEAFIMYTSGTTGNPKGVVSTHRAVVSALRGVLCYPSIGSLAAQAGASAAPSTPQPQKPQPQPAVICPVPLFHATGSHSVFLLSLLVGRKVVLMHKWDPLEALKLIESEKVTSFVGVPTMSMELLNHPDYDKYDVSSLADVGGGGAAPPAKLSSQTAKKGKSAGQGWGLTESNAMTVLTSSSKDYVRNPASCGRPMPFIDIKVVDEANKELPPGTPGEILIRGVTIMKEYWRKPEATAEAISVDGWFRTGDIGRVDPDGALYIMDRAKDLIIRGGENISSAEVETAIYEHPAVQECSVFSMPDERLGEVVAAAVVQKPGSPALDGAELQKFALQKLAKFKVPTEIYLWNQGEQLPRGATGKIPKRTIKDQIKAGTAACTRILPLPSKL